MRRAQQAEWLLSLVGDSDRASSTVGDLAEVAGEDHPLWFWSHVAGTMLFQAGRSLRIQPWRTLLLVLGGLVLAQLWAIFFFVIGAIGSMVVGMGQVGLECMGWSAVASIWLVPWIVGRWIALNATGREVAAGLAMTLFFWALAAWLQPHLSWELEPVARIFWVGGKMAYPVALVASAVLVRRQSLRAPA